MKKIFLLAVFLNASLCYSASTTSDDASFDETDDSLPYHHLPSNLLAENQNTSDELEVSGNEELAKKYGLPDTLDFDTAPASSASSLPNARDAMHGVVAKEGTSFSDIVLPDTLDSPPVAKPAQYARRFDYRRAQGQRVDNCVGPSSTQTRDPRICNTHARSSKPLNERNNENSRFTAARPANAKQPTRPVVPVSQAQQDARSIPQPFCANAQPSINQDSASLATQAAALVNPALHMAQGAQSYYQQAGYIQVMQMHQTQNFQAHVQAQIAMEQQRQQQLAMAWQFYRDAIHIQNQGSAFFGDNNFQHTPPNDDRASFALHSQSLQSPPASHPAATYVDAREFQATPSSSSSSSAVPRRPHLPAPSRSQALYQAIPYHNRPVNRHYAPVASTAHVGRNPS